MGPPFLVDVGDEVRYGASRVIGIMMVPTTTSSRMSSTRAVALPGTSVPVPPVEFDARSDHH
jgi:hypothetical protein